VRHSEAMDAVRPVFGQKPRHLRTRGSVRIVLSAGGAVSIDNVPGYQLLAEWLRLQLRVPVPASSGPEGHVVDQPVAQRALSHVD